MHSDSSECGGILDDYPLHEFLYPGYNSIGIYNGMNMKKIVMDDFNPRDLNSAVSNMRKSLKKQGNGISRHMEDFISIFEEELENIEISLRCPHDELLRKIISFILDDIAEDPDPQKIKQIYFIISKYMRSLKSGREYFSMITYDFFQFLDSYVEQAMKTCDYLKSLIRTFDDTWTENRISIDAYIHLLSGKTHLKVSGISEKDPKFSAFHVSTDGLLKLQTKIFKKLIKHEIHYEELIDTIINKRYSIIENFENINDNGRYELTGPIVETLDKIAHITVYWKENIDYEFNYENIPKVNERTKKFLELTIDKLNILFRKLYRSGA